jgi:hypothetical protein
MTTKQFLERKARQEIDKEIMRENTKLLEAFKEIKDRIDLEQASEAEKESLVRREIEQMINARAMKLS